MKASSAVLLILSVFALGQCDFASTTVGPGNDECRDLLPRCADGIQHGACAHIGNLCLLSCNLCTSSRETVTASTPPSRTWPTYSSTSAATTTADSETCKDSNPRCPALAQHGLCIHPRLHHQCKLSCNVCESGSSTSAAPPTTTTATTTDYYPHY